MNLIIGVVVIGIIIAGIAFFMASKSDSKNTTKEELQSTAKRESQSRIQGESQGTTQKESQNISTKEEVSADMQAVKQKEQLYHYMTQELQNLVCVYNKEEWSQLKKLGEISQELYKEKNDIIEGLSTITGRMVKEYFTCVDFREEEGKLVGYVNDIEKLKQVFLQFMMPFYPYYYKELSEGGLRYTALLHPNTLRLFQQLTGKKFRPGYRNRYSTGVRAFEWDKDRYKVYGKDGRLLCDAVFDSDGIKEGYGQKKYLDKQHPDWNIVEEGSWKEGGFQSGILRYEYKKSVQEDLCCAVCLADCFMIHSGILLCTKKSA